ncbi:MAG TPA: potassium-transporting ATPase subunit KdpA [Planctomycetota bacterium]|nr:potassium-transporting ATPase subunit KdpA [Planctomycetota bacterium]
MTTNGYLQIALYLGALIGLSFPLGWYMAKVYEGEPPGLAKLLKPLERFLYWLCRVKPDEEMDWKRYAIAMLIFNMLGALVVYGLQRLQGVLSPAALNPEGLGAVTPDSSFNTATSFATNTNWQGYAGETTMSYLVQMAALTVQNFCSAATGMACLIPLIRAFARKTTQNLGNFWVDLFRSTLYILMPLSIVLALVLVSQGTIQNFTPYQTATLVEANSYDEPVNDDAGKPVMEQVKDEKGVVQMEEAKDDKGTIILVDNKPKMQPKVQPKMKTTAVKELKIPMGPAASQIAIKQLGTNGGGYFNVNSAHPFENPTPLANFLEMLSILLISGGLCITFGYMVKDRRQGVAILAAMTILLVGFMALCVGSEQSGNPAFARMGVNQTASDMQAGGNMEGKETRFGVVNSAIWATVTTGASNGSVNAMHDSFTPLGGLVPLLMIQLGEVIYGGVGSGLYGMLVFAIGAVFIAGLMVGRTPEYLGKKIETYEMKMVAIAILVPPMLSLIGTAIAVLAEPGFKSTSNDGAHGFSELLYAYSSMGNNNGSAFAGLNANIPLHNILGGFSMLFSRFALVVPVLAMAGSLAAKKSVPVSAGTLPTHTPLFVALLVSKVLIVGALTFIPALALGPIVEHLQMVAPPKAAVTSQQ